MIKELDETNEDVGLQPDQVVRRQNLQVELWSFLNNKESLAHQRSRVRWLKEGDAISKFFHTCLNSRRASNLISTLKTQDGWMEDVVGVKTEVVNKFSKLFADSS